jgi:transposase
VAPKYVSVLRPEIRSHVLGKPGRNNNRRSSGRKERLGRVSKMGNRYLRTLLVVGAHAVLYHRKLHDDALRSFAKKLMQTKPFNRARCDP